MWQYTTRTNNNYISVFDQNDNLICKISPNKDGKKNYKAAELIRFAPTMYKLLYEIFESGKCGDGSDYFDDFDKLKKEINHTDWLISHTTGKG
jgi:hypothetical protein